MRNYFLQTANILLLFIGISGFTYLPANAQCAMRELSLSERVGQSEYIFEGELIDQYSLWNVQKTHIFTINKIKVFKDFTQNADPEILLLTQGGTVGEISEVVSPNLYLQKGDKGIFFANLTTDITIEATRLLENEGKNTGTAAVNHSYLLQPFGAAQGFVRYNDDAMKTAFDVYTQYFDIEKQIYRPIAEQKGHVFRTIYTPKPQPALKQLLIPAISAISPTILRAGMKDTIYITGTGFGTFIDQAALQFRNPDYYGFSISYQSVQAANIISWTDTQIIAIVPGRDIAVGGAGAGSGSIRVRNSTGTVTTSDQEITVLYNRHVHNSFSFVNLSNDNTSGGYTFTYNTNFNTNTAAKNALQRALQTWVCGAMTNFNFAATTTTTNCPAADNINLVSFDNNCLLATGTLAQTTQWYTSCSNGDKYYMEMDIIFSSATAWNYGPAATGTTQKDFESIALHELGHAQGMGHVSDYGKIMYPSLSSAVDIRSIDADALTCVQNIVARSKELNGCGSSAYIPVATCGLKLKINALLQGAYNTTNGNMNTQLTALLPTNQPFNQAPWNYTGTETIANLPANITDWVLVEVRQNATSTLLARKAALLRQDGTVVGTDGSIGVNFLGLTPYTTPYYIVLRSRNHLAVMSQNTLTLPNITMLDFSNSANVRGSNQLTNVGGKYALWAGDGNANGVVNIADFNVFMSQTTSSPNQYLKADYNMDGSITIGDFNLYRPNAAIIGVSEIRY